MKRWRALIPCLTLLGFLAVPARATEAADVTTVSQLTSTGQMLSIAITSPADGSRANVPAGTLTVTGTASMGALINTGNAVYAIDVSGSTLSPTGQDCNGDGVFDDLDDINGDDYGGSTLDCEAAGMIVLNRKLAANGGTAAGVVVFGESATVVDVDPADGLQALTGMTADHDQNGLPDIEDVARSLQAGGVNAFTPYSVGTDTNYDDALTDIATIFADKAGQNNVAFFLSDGAPTKFTQNGPLATVAALGVKVHTYSIGRLGAGCGPLSALTKISLATGGTCTKVVDPSKLSAILKQPLAMAGVKVSLNGGTPIPVALNAGNWSVSLTGLTGGIWNQIVATATASDGTQAVARLQVYGNRPPVVDAGGNYTVDEGAPLQLHDTASDPDGDAVTLTWAPSPRLTGGDTATPIYRADDNLTDSLKLTATDVDGLQSAATATVTVQNVPPAATFVAPATASLGSRFTLALTNPFDPSPADTAAGFTYSYDCGTGQGFTANPVCIVSSPKEQKVRARIADKDGGYTEYTATVSTLNLPPKITGVSAPEAVQVGTAVAADVAFTDPESTDTHTVQWDWGDGTSSSGTVNDGAGTGTGSHTYVSPGLYPITATVTDSVGNRAQAAIEYVAIFDPNVKEFTGDGRIDWPDSKAKGPDDRARLTARVKYDKGQLVPKGKTEFKAPGLDFDATDYQWLVITGARAQYKGFGTIKGKGNYGFMVTAIDGKRTDDGIDRLRVKIWDAATGTVTYDSQPGDSALAPVTTPLTDGNMHIH